MKHLLILLFVSSYFNVFSQYEVNLYEHKFLSKDKYIGRIVFVGDDQDTTKINRNVINIKPGYYNMWYYEQIETTDSLYLNIRFVGGWVQHDEMGLHTIYDPVKGLNLCDVLYRGDPDNWFDEIIFVKVSKRKFFK